MFVILRDEQYRIMWNELETLVKTHAGNTDRHQRVLDCVIACRSKPPEEEERKKRGRKREDREDRTEKNGSKDTDDKSWQDSERLFGFTYIKRMFTKCCSLMLLHLLSLYPKVKGFAGERRPGIRGYQRFSGLPRTAQQEAARVRGGGSSSRESKRLRRPTHFCSLERMAR